MVLCCKHYGLGLLPIALFVNTAGCFLTTYLIGASLGHISFEFPYISDTGSDPPESCIFTFFLSISSFLAAATIYLRWRHIIEYNREDTERVLRLNKISFYIGMTSPLGMLLVASFQNVNVFPVHILGAAMAFICGCIYAWMHTYITFRMKTNSCRVLDFRFIISVMATLSLIVAGTYAEIALTRLRGKFDSKNALHWHPADGGFKSHIVSTVGEWCLGFSFLLFFLTFTKDFSRISFDLQIRLQLDDPMLQPSVSDAGGGYVGTYDERQALLQACARRVGAAVTPVRPLRASDA